MEIHFITGNTNKYNEAANLIPGLKQLDVDLPEIQDVDPQVIIEAKLNEARKHHQGCLIVEDTSLYLDCLGGKLPGPLIKWFLETLGNKGIYELCQKYKNYNVVAKTVVGYSDKKGINFFEGTVKGTIVSPRGDVKFGWDPIFLPENSQKTFAEMESRDKNLISMRKGAFEKLSNHFK